MMSEQGFSIRKNSRKELLLDLFFPNKCPFCQKAVHWTKYCCDECYSLSGIADANKMFCRRCGEFACKCGKEQHFFDFCIIGGVYENEYIKNAVLSMKYKRSENSAEIFAHCVSKAILSDNKLPKPDCIVPVPMNIRHKRERGYNQAEFFGEHLSKKLNIPMKTELLEKIYTNKSQHKRNADERKISVKNEYNAARNAEIKGNIILCDDIMTTGSTLDRCAEILKSIGAEKVILAVCARA